MKRRLGKLMFVLVGIREAWSYRGKRATLMLDGKRLEAVAGQMQAQVTQVKGSPALDHAVKALAHLPQGLHLLPPLVTRSLSHFKTDVLKGKMTSLDLEETLIALSISATLNPMLPMLVYPAL